MTLVERPARATDLLRRYRQLCEASGIARASRLPLAPPLQEELATLQERLLALLNQNSRAVLLARESEGPAPVPTPSTPEPVSLPPANPGPPPAAKPAAIVFTDGAAEGNPGPGGYCAIVRIPGYPDRELSGSSIHTTNNKMELAAAIAGLRAVADAGIADVTVISDSEYLIKGMTEWLPEWERRGWKTASGQPVKNRELWQELASLVRGRNVKWEWIKGHAGHPENERCDLVATAAAHRAARARPV